MFGGYVSLASQIIYPIIVYFVANYTPYLSHFRARLDVMEAACSIFKQEY